MTVRVGVIGVGMIGEDHIRRLTTVLSGAEVVAVSDIDVRRADYVAATMRGDVRVHQTGEDLIGDARVDAAVVCSWGRTHEEFVVAAIAAGKPVFCEKPLATTPEACSHIVDAEVALGRRLVQVGYMRRYDAAYLALRDVVRGGSIGLPLLMHCAHRGPTVSSHFEKDSAITDAAVHEIDLVRWLFDEEIVATSVLNPRRNRNGGDLPDPLVLLLEMASGILVDVEVSLNIRYGYDIRGEVVAENGTATLGEPNSVTVRINGVVVNRVPADWRERFSHAYDSELQSWLDAIRFSGEFGPSSWDGYAAAVVSDAALAARRTGTRATVSLPERPALYQ